MHCDFYINKPQHLELLQAVIYCFTCDKRQYRRSTAPPLRAIPSCEKRDMKIHSTDKDCSGAVALLTDHSTIPLQILCSSKCQTPPL